MSWAARKWASRQPLPPKPYALLRALGDHANDKNKCWPSLPTLRAATSFCRTVLIREGQFLERLGLVSRKHRGPNSLLYTLHLDRNVTPEEVQKWTSTSARRSPSRRFQEVHRVDPIPIEPQERAALPARAPSHEQGQRAARPPELKSEIETEAARARGRGLAPSHAHGNGQAAHDARQDLNDYDDDFELRKAIMMFALTGELDLDRSATRRARVPGATCSAGRAAGPAAMRRRALSRFVDPNNLPKAEQERRRKVALVSSARRQRHGNVPANAQKWWQQMEDVAAEPRHRALMGRGPDTVRRGQVKRRRQTRPPQPSLSVAELALFLDGDRDLAYRVLRLLRIKAYGDQPPRVPVGRLQAWERRRRALACTHKGGSMATGHGCHIKDHVSRPLGQRVRTQPQ